MEEWRTMRGISQIPPFGNWDYCNELPITQYFDCARHAGLFRYSSSSGESDSVFSGANSDLYAVDASYRKPPPRSNKGKVGREKRGVSQGNYNKNKGEVNIKKHGAKGKVFNVTVTELYPTPSEAIPTAKLYSTNQQQQFKYNVRSQSQPPKAVDEDLYKIPPELLKRKRRLGFFSRCLVPPCAV